MCDPPPQNESFVTWASFQLQTKMKRGFENRPSRPPTFHSPQHSLQLPDLYDLRTIKINISTAFHRYQNLKIWKGDMRLILWWKVTYTPRQYLQLGLHLTRGIRQVKEKGVFVKIRYVGNCLMTSFGNVHPQFFLDQMTYIGKWYIYHCNQRQVHISSTMVLVFEICMWLLSFESGR